METVFEGFVAVALVLGTSWFLAYSEVKRQLGGDYKHFVSFCKMQARKAEEEGQENLRRKLRDH